MDRKFGAKQSAYFEVYDLVYGNDVDKTACVEYMMLWFDGAYTIAQAEAEARAAQEQINFDPTNATFLPCDWTTVYETRSKMVAKMAEVNTFHGDTLRLSTKNRGFVPPCFTFSLRGLKNVSFAHR